VFNKTLWDRRSSIWAWIGAIGFILLVTFSAWPSFSKDAASLEQLISSLPPEIFALFGTADPSSLAQAPGFISSRAFQSIGPILVAVLGISSVRTLIASEESNGQFDLVVSHPVTRRRVLRDKAKGIFALHAVLAISLTVVTIVGNAAVGTGLEVTNMIAANVGLALLGIAFTGLTLAAWSFTSASGTSMRWVSGVAGVMWFLNGLGSIVDVLAPFRPLSLFYWYLGDVAPLGKGFELGYLPLLAVGVVGTAIAILRIDRRDLAI
jgi:ABC-2 type transport system permease protein